VTEQAGQAGQADGTHRPRRLALDPALEARAARAARAITGQAPTFRSTLALAVERQLDQVVALLTEAGLTHQPGGKARPREVDDHIWERLGEAEEAVGVGKVELIRCCLERLARGEDI
jgi:hypothetical protein